MRSRALDPESAGGPRRVAKGSISTFSCDNSINPPTGLPNNGFIVASVYIFGASGEQLSEISNPSATQTPAWQVAHTNVYAAGQQIATYDADLTGATEGNLYFHLSDWLGTRRQQTDYAGNPVLNFTGLPYGDGLSVVPIPSTSAQDATEHHFTGKERDTESGNDYFGARYFASSMGRMLSPDPVGGSLANPQTLNKYAYVLNNPLSFTDPTGLYACADDAADAKEHCTSDDDQKFEASRQHDLQSKNAAIRAAAAAYGDPGNAVVDARGDKVTVGFSSSVSSNGEGGVTHSVLDANGNTPISNSTVTFGVNDKGNLSDSGTALDADIGHEGSHVEDAQSMASSITFDSKGNYTIGQDISQYTSEQRAYGITDSIYRSANEPYNGCGNANCALGAGSSPIGIPGRVDAILLANPGIYKSALNGKPLTPTNQGANVLGIVVPH